jgi:hypothetical protein
MSETKLHDIQLNGLAHDLMHAKRHIQLFNAIKNNWDKIDKLSNEDSQWISFLKLTSVQQAVLYMSKLYDSSGERKGNKLRCIRDLLKEITNLKLETAISINVIWSNFYSKHKKAIDSLGKVGAINSGNFQSSFQSYLDKEFDKSISDEFVLKRLKFIRNKIVAHNEVVTLDTKIELEEIENLIFIADAFLDFTNTMLSLGQISLYSEPEYVMKVQIDKIFYNINK